MSFYVRFGRRCLAFAVPCCFPVVVCASPEIANHKRIRTVYVDDDAPNDPGPGDTSVSDPLEDGSRAHPFDAIQEAIDIVRAGDTVLVQDGVYTGSGNRKLDVLGKAIVIASANGPESCVIDAQGAKRIINFTNGEGPDTILDGFTLQNGSANNGAGLRCTASSSPTIRNCIIRDCVADTSGGAIYCTNSSPLIENCLIQQNSARQYGGGIYLFDSYATIHRCDVLENESIVGYGGGIYTDASPALIDRCFVAANTAQFGGGIRAVGRLTIRNSLITANSATGDHLSLGGGLSLNTGTVTISHCTIVANRADAEAGGISSSQGSQEITNCIIRGNEAPYGPQISTTLGADTSVQYSNVDGGQWAIQGTVAWGSGNIDTEPFYVDPDGPDGIPTTWQDNDFHLQLHSPSVGTGDPNFVPDASETDTDGEARVFGDVVDMGFDEAHDCDDNITPDYLDLNSGDAQDCNSNLTPDSCDIDNGISLDTNSNGVPDECE